MKLLIKSIFYYQDWITNVCDKFAIEYDDFNKNWDQLCTKIKTTKMKNFDCCIFTLE